MGGFGIRMRDSGRSVVAWVAILVLAAGCGGGVSPTPTPTSTSTPAPTSEASGSQTQSAAQPVSGSPVPANQPQTIHLSLLPGGDTEISVRSLNTGCNATPCQGDYRLGDDALFDPTTGKQVGTLVYVEFAVITGVDLFHSPANTITLAERGQIVFTETLYDDGSGRPATGVIIGGTGEFLGATGYVISRSLSNRGDFVITITE